MYYSEQYGPPPTVGVEFEVPGWIGNTTLASTVGRLQDGGYCNPGARYDVRHEYHCTCRYCNLIANRVLAKPQWKVQRDASLPADGAEFISSPFPAQPAFVDQVCDALETVSYRARDATGVRAENGRVCETGMHVHTHVLGPELNGFDRQLMLEHADIMWLYTPELFALARANARGTDRSLQYRHANKPSHLDDPNHGFVSIKGGTNRTGTALRLEWRLWEADYSEGTTYREAMIYISAALTQLMMNDDIMGDLYGVGATLQRKNRNVIPATPPRRDCVEMLRHAVTNVSGLVQLPDKAALVAGYFDRLETE